MESSRERGEGNLGLGGLKGCGKTVSEWGDSGEKRENYRTDPEFSVGGRRNLLGET